MLWTLRKKYPYWELCWSLFSRNRTEYGDILHISSCSVQIRENTDQNNSEYGRFLRSGNQYKYFAFNILLCSILIISYKTLNITWIYNEKTKELTIYAIFYQNVTIFYRQELASLFQLSKRHNILPTRTSFFISKAGKIETVREFQMKIFE